MCLVRRFLTAIALDQQSTKFDVHIPHDISVYDPENVRTTVDAAINNVNQNKQTIDGKITTHSIAVVLYQRSPKPEETHCIPRTNKKQLDAQSWDEDETTNPILNQNHVLNGKSKNWISLLVM